MIIKGNTVGTPTPRTNYEQTDPAKADYLKGKEALDVKIGKAQSAADNAKTAADNAQTAADNAQKTADNALPKSGGTITGELSVPDPTEAVHAANMGWVMKNALNLMAITDEEHIIPTGADLNNYTSIGAYRIQTAAESASLTNMAPYTSAGARLIVSATSASNEGVIQILIFDSNKNHIYFRIQASDTVWGAWTQIASKLDAYPVGSIYLSVTATSPASLFGGTWTQLKDRFLLGAGSNYTAGETGGAATVTLSESQMPKHTHKLVMDSNYNTGDYSTQQLSVGQPIGANDQNGNIYTNDNPVKSAGSGKAHNNMPPYLVVYMWKRTE